MQYLTCKSCLEKTSILNQNNGDESAEGKVLCLNQYRVGVNVLSKLTCLLPSVYPRILQFCLFFKSCHLYSFQVIKTYNFNLQER